MIELPKMAQLDELDSKLNPIIYHYCSLETFLSVLTNRTFRLSDINTLNDFSEMHWAYDRFIEAINSKIDHLDKKFIEFLDARISTMQLHTLPLVGCFSTDGDVLSQWRAYANNGAGVSIGFDSQLIGDLSVRCAPVEYRHEVQVGYFADLIDSLRPAWEMNFHEEDWALEYLLYSAFDMCLIKNPAFSEEKEVRIVRAVTVNAKDGAITVEDHGGVGKDKIAKRKHPIKFRVRSGGLIAHIDLNLGANFNTIIKEVVLGPKSESGPNEIGMALSANGFRGFRVSHSTATYR